MGVEFYHCDCCNESKYEEYVGTCEKCEHSLCTRCLENNDIGSNYAHDYGERYDGSDEQKLRMGIEDDWEEKGYVELNEVLDDTGIQEKYCPFCQNTAFDEVRFHEWLYEKLTKSKGELMDEYLKSEIIPKW